MISRAAAAVRRFRGRFDYGPVKNIALDALIVVILDFAFVLSYHIMFGTPGRIGRILLNYVVPFTLGMAMAELGWKSRFYGEAREWRSFFHEMICSNVGFRTVEGVLCCILAILDFGVGMVGGLFGPKGFGYVVLYQCALQGSSLFFVYVCRKCFYDYTQRFRRWVIMDNEIVRGA